MNRARGVASRCWNACRPKWRADNGEIASWLILAAGLALAAAAASTILQVTISALASEVGQEAAGPGVPGEGPGPVEEPGPPTGLRTILQPGEPLPPVTGPPVLQPPLPDGDETDNNFWPGDHYYTHTSPATSADYQALIDAVNQRGVHPNQTEPFVPGEPYTGDVDIPGPFGVDNVTTTAIYDEHGNQVGVRNETEPNHALHPGWVERTIVLDENGDYRIQTAGGGTGALGGPNVWFDELVWSDVDDRALEGLPGGSQ